MARIAFILPPPKGPQGVVDQARRLTASGDDVAIPYDRWAPPMPTPLRGFWMFPPKVAHDLAQTPHLFTH
ncbi:hypothetical protein [Paracoccus sp. S3-43]|uniref:hypothetical protein n=1 Tax=Paracoccus sp. S3-43 TaxID=3030011 RepID=UPI0023B119A4|nr:hypothetical protein [Paracoccus sp. S3-43]WEF24975.1 hypothetical protein PXD02_03160 [Paracoccus sp. S3-43]